jgi:Ion transport protein
MLSYRHFDDISNLMVIFSSILLAVDNPLDDPKSKKQAILSILDYTMTAIFSVEALIKIVVLGFFFNGKKSYFRRSWNKIDFIVVCISLLTYLPLGANLQYYKSMRLLRVLRPLRMIQRNPGLKVAVRSL